MTSSRVTKPGTRRLSEVARHVVTPEGIVATGWGDVERTCSKMGVAFDEWQRGAGRLILAKRADGTLATTVGGVGMSLPRQVGKTYLLSGLTFALCIRRPGTLVIWSAHHGKTHEETFLAMQGFAERAKVKPYVKKVYTGSGDESVHFHNESRILFGAREHGFGRGIPGVDVLVFDEAQILSDKAMAAMLATMNTSSLGLHLYIGTPPRTDELHKAVAFSTMRHEALTGEAEDSVWIECGADPKADPEDRRQWARANPSYPHRTPLQAFLRLKKRLSSEDFMREGLGVWDDVRDGGIFPRWSDCLDAEMVQPDDVPAIGLAGSSDGLYAAIGAASLLDDGRLAVAPVGERRTGQRWLVEEAARIHRERDCAVVVDERGPLSYLVPALEEAGVRLTLVGTSEWCDACGSLWQAVEDGRLAHTGDADLSAAVRAASWRPVGDRRAFGRKSADISMLEAVTLAAHVTTALNARSAYADHDPMFV